MLYSTDKNKPWKQYPHSRVFKYGHRNYIYTHNRNIADSSLLIFLLLIVVLIVSIL